MARLSEQLVIGGRYVSRKRPGVKIQVEAVEGQGVDALAGIYFLKSGQRHKAPAWLIVERYRRDVAQ